jgi:hypothetical protein
MEKETMKKVTEAVNAGLEFIFDILKIPELTRGSLRSAFIDKFEKTLFDKKSN